MNVGSTYQRKKTKEKRKGKERKHQDDYSELKYLEELKMQDMKASSGQREKQR